MDEISNLRPTPNQLTPIAVPEQSQQSQTHSRTQQPSVPLNSLKRTHSQASDQPTSLPPKVRMMNQAIASVQTQQQVGSGSNAQPNKRLKSEPNNELGNDTTTNSVAGKDSNFVKQARPRSNSLPTDQTQQTNGQPIRRTNSLPDNIDKLILDCVHRDGDELGKSRQSLDTTEFVDKADKSTVKYAVQAALNKDPLNEVDLQRIRLANHAIDETRSQIPLRGNVSRDIRQSDGESRHRAALGQSLTRDRIIREEFSINEQLLDGDITKEEAANEEIALAQDTRNYRVLHAAETRGGNCLEMGLATTRNAASRFADDETATVRTVASAIPGVDHAFSQIIPSDDISSTSGIDKSTDTGKSAGLNKLKQHVDNAGYKKPAVPSNITADAWMNGPASRAKDSTKMHQGLTNTLETFTKSTDKEELAKHYEGSKFIFKPAGNTNEVIQEMMKSEADLTKIESEYREERLIHEEILYATGITTQNQADERIKNIAGENPMFPYDPVDPTDPNNRVGGIYNEAQSLSPQFRDGARAGALELYSDSSSEEKKRIDQDLNKTISNLTEMLKSPQENINAEAHRVARRESIKPRSMPPVNRLDAWTDYKGSR